MEFKVRFFRGAVKADLTVDRVTLIAGQNGAGKSSVLQAVAAARSSSPLPFFKAEKPDSALVNKKDAQMLIHEGRERGGVLYKDDDGGTVQIGWGKELTVQTDGNPKPASRIACGLYTPIDMIDADRSRFFSTLLHTKPTKDDFTRALNDSGLVAEDFPQYHEPIWSELEIQGFDAVHSNVKNEVTRLRGKWEGVTGDRYGSNKAASYLPAGWVPDLADITVENHDETVAEARQAVESEIAKAAISESELDGFIARAAKERGAADELQRAEQAVSKYEPEVNRLAQVSRSAGEGQVFPCAHCGGLNLVTQTQDGPQVEASEQTEDEIADAREAAAKAKKIYDDALNKLTDLRHTRNVARETLKQYTGAKEALELAQARKGSRENLDTARDYLTSVEKEHKALTTKLAADASHKQIVEKTTLVEVLSPEGIRQEIMVKRLSEFNNLLAQLSQSAKFGQVSLSDDLMCSYDARPYFLLADSQKWRCRAIIQISVAMKDESNFVVLDGADILDQAGRNGLVGMLVKMAPGFKSLIAMTMSRRELVPDLEARGLGSTVWMENGVVVPKAGA